MAYAHVSVGATPRGCPFYPIDEGGHIGPPLQKPNDQDRPFDRLRACTGLG